MTSDELKLDTQVIELLGRNRLVSELLLANLEVAFPERDRGIDLIAYDDLSVDTFVAKPIQMKAASTSSFSINRKYERVKNLIITYVWHLEDPSRAVTYALTYEEALKVAMTMGYTETNSWTLAGSYSVNTPGDKLRSLLVPYEMTPKKWREKILGPREV